MKKSVKSFLALAYALLFLSSSVTLAQVHVDRWAKTDRGTAWPILNDSTTAAGNASIGSGAPPTDWSTIRGGFSTVEASTDSAIIVSGHLEFVGGGCDNAYTHLRYALTYQDSVTLNYQYTDSAIWVSTKTHFGYQFTPRTGTGIMASGTNGVGTVWSLYDVAGWNSTYNANIKPIIVVNQSPRNAEMMAGVYDWAISVQPLGDGTNEVRWYMVEQNNRYWFGGTAIDTVEASTKFNGICFGFNDDLEATQVNLTGVQVDLGDPLDINYGCPCVYYVEDWGFIGGRTGGWDFVPGELTGNAGVAGEMPATGWVAVRGGFWDSFAPVADRALILEGKIEFVGGGFEAANSFRFGIFDSDSAGTALYTNTDSAQWSGSEAHHSGYLFIPPSGTNGPAGWTGIDQQVPGQPGTCGAVIDDTWFGTDGTNNYVLGSILQVPANAVAGAGRYKFAISIEPQMFRYISCEIRFKLVKEDSSYIFAGTVIDNHTPLATGKFNCVAFALNTNESTTAMYISDVTPYMGEPIDIPANIETAGRDFIPAVYILNQNYPNPFNPETQIRYSIPRSGNISLKVYDLPGREVAVLFSGVLQPGSYTATFDATGLASGIYFYQLKTNDFMKTNKMVVLK
jgi:hypothetical protein